MKKRFSTRPKMVLFFLEGSKRYFALSVIFACMVSVFDLANPKIIEYTVDSVIGDQPLAAPLIIRNMLDSMGGMAFLKTHLYVIGLAVALFALLGALFRYLFRLMNSIAAETLVQRMRESLFDHILGLPYAWFGQNHTGDIIQRCTSDVETIKVFLSEQLVSLFQTTMMIVISIAFMVGIHGRLALVAALFIPVMIAGSVIFHEKIGNSFEKVDAEEGRVSSIAQENLTGVRVVRAFGREAYERERFEKMNEEYTGLWVYLMKILSAFWTIDNVIGATQALCVVVLGAVFCVQGSLSAGGLIAFVSYNALLSYPVRSLGRVITEMSKAGIAIDRISYIMNSQVEQDREDALTPPMDQDITFDHVSYHYEGQADEVLEDVSFRIRAGETLGILGGTGSGKSTLMYLLDRLYELPEGKGSITIGDTDIRRIRLDHLRKNIGIVLQEPFLFSRTLAGNIGITSEHEDMQKVRKAAALAALDDTIRGFVKGYDTFVGERGVTLSGGQKQRTAIAQVLVKKPPIMIFDDSLSAVDAETDQKIRDGLREGIGQATVILIAHRITTLMRADRIIVLDKGRVKEMGTHEELLAQNGIYARTYALQTRDQ